MIPTESNRRTFDERRKSHRYAVSGSRRDGRLRLGQREVAVEILDESACGVAVAFDGPPGCEPGETLLLEIASGWTEVQVVNVRREESAPAEEGVESGERTRLGLVRLRDLEPGEVDPEPIDWLSIKGFKTLLAPLTPVGRPLQGAAALIIGVPLFAVVLIWALDNLEWSLPVDDDHVARSVPPLPDVHLRPTRPRAETVPMAPERAEPPVAVRPAEPQETVPEEQATVPEKIVRVSRPDFFLKPEITKLLALSQEQLHQLRVIWEEYQAAMKDAISAGTFSPPREGDRDVQFGRRSLAVLTQEQMAALQRFLSTPEAEKESLGANEPPIENAVAP
jgi:hypothetical protein